MVLGPGPNDSTDVMKKKVCPLEVGSLVRVKHDTFLMRGTVETNGGENIGIDKGMVLMVAAIVFFGKNPHKTWWHIDFIHGTSMYWRIVHESEIEEGYEVIPMKTIALDLQDRMLDEEDDWDEFCEEDE